MAVLNPLGSCVSHKTNCMCPKTYNPAIKIGNIRVTYMLHTGQKFFNQLSTTASIIFRVVTEIQDKDRRRE